MVETIVNRYRENVVRVEHMLAAFDERTGDDGRSDTRSDTDFLRAGVVFLHASLEDFVRSIEEWRLPLASASALQDLAGRNDVPLKLTLRNVADRRGTSVDDWVEELVNSYLERSNYSRPEHVIAALRRVGIETREITELADDLAALMARRHWIAHRMDRAGPGMGRAEPITRRDLRNWLETVNSVVTVVAGDLR